MKRRKFLKKAAATATASLVLPYILPSGRLFAATGSALADHVVYVLFAGGVRQQEAVLQRYLDDSQGEPIAGNILYNMLVGQAPSQKIVYGTTPGGQPDGSQPISKILGQTIQEQGTTFAEVRYSKGGTGHFAGLNTCVTGNYGIAQGLRERPLYPTIFEYVRKHLNLSASDVWFVGNGIGNSTPLLNYSDHPDFGAKYGANFLAPNVTFGSEGEEHIMDGKIYHPDEELSMVYDVQHFLNNSFNLEAGVVGGVRNSDEEKHNIKEFIRQMFIKKQSGTIAHPPVADSGDLTTVGYTCEVLKWFKPKLTVVNMSSIDSCHGSFTSYLKAMHRCDHAVGHLWNYIQTQIPEMAGNTAMIITPEHGRNLNPNPILDKNDWRAFDHDSDNNSRRVFTQMVGPGIQANDVQGSESNPKGDSADSILTVADLLGIKNEVIADGWLDVDAMSLFDRI